MRLKIPDLLPGTAYAIQVRAVGVDSVSEWSNKFEITTATDATLPDAPMNVTWGVSGDSFIGTWSAVTTNEAGGFVKVERYEAELTANAVSIIDSVIPSTGTTVKYELPFERNRAFFGTPRGVVALRVRSVDSQGNKSVWTSSITASNPAPAAPTAPVVKEVTDGVDLSWTPPADNDLIGYTVYVGTTENFVPASSNRVYLGDAPNFLYTSTTYSLQYFKIRSIDKFEQESASLAAQGTPKSPFTVDTTPPSTPTALTAPITNNINGVGATASVSWAHTAETDLAGFNLRWRKVGDTVYFQTTIDKESRSASVELPLAYTNYEFQIRASDWSANYSAWSPTVTSVSPSNTAPAQVTGVTMTAGKEDVKVAWTANTEPDLANYEVQIATNSTFTAGLLTYRIAATTLSVTGLAVNTQYWSRVRAFDTGELAGSYSTSATATTSSYPAGASSDGFPPGSSPTPNVMSGIGYLYTTWSPVTVNSNGGAQNDPVTYDIHLSTTSGFIPDGTTKVTEVSGTFAVIDVLPGTTTPLTYGTTYYIKTVARDRDGSAAASAQGSGTPAKAASTDVSSVSADTIIAGSGIINNLIINTGGSIQSSNYVAGTTGFRIDNTSFNLGSNGTVNAGALKAGTVTSTTVNIGAGGTLNVDATGEIRSNNWSGSYNAVTGTGWQLNSSGLVINNGSVSAKALKSSTLATATISLATDGIIQTEGYNGTSGFSLSGSGLTIKTGTIEAAALNIQAGPNMAPARYATFPLPANQYTFNPTAEITASVVGTDGAVVPKLGDQQFKITFNNLTVARAQYMAPGTSGLTDSQHTIDVEGGRTYIISAWVYAPVAATTTSSFALNVYQVTSAGAVSGGIQGNTQTIPAATWTRVYTQIAVPAGWSRMIIGPASYFLGVVRTYYVSGIQVEAQVANAITPSPFNEPAMTRIDGAFIKTGSIQSSATTTVNGQVVPLWSINTSGSASFANAQIRGNTVVGVASSQDGAASQIASGNYAAGNTGWMIRSDGFAEFRNLASNSVYSDRLSIGTKSMSVLYNGNMEDPKILTTGIDSSQFGGWNTQNIVGSGATLSQNITTPISGTRSLRLTTANASSGLRVIQTDMQPVVEGQVWEVSARCKFSRVIDKRAQIPATPVVKMTFHTSKGGVDPAGNPDSNITWQDLISGDAVSPETTSRSVTTTDSSKTITSTTAWRAGDAGLQITGPGITPGTTIEAVEFNTASPPAPTTTAYLSEPAGPVFDSNDVLISSPGTGTGTVSGIYTLNGVFKAPPGHTKMKVSMVASPANDGSSYWVDWDDVNVTPADIGINVVSSAGDIVASIDNRGNAKFNDIEHAGFLITSGNGLLIDGAPIGESFVTDDLQTTNEPIFQSMTLTQHIKKQFKLKMAAEKSSANTSTNSGSTTAAFLEGEVNVVAGNTYRMTYNFVANTGTANTVWDTTVNYTTDGSIPTANSTELSRGTQRWINPTTNATGIGKSFYFTSTTTGRWRFVLCNRQVAGAATSAVVFFSSKYMATVMIDDVGPSLDGVSTNLVQRNMTSGTDTTDTTPPPDNTTLTKYTKTWNATWSRGYDESGGSISTGSDHKQGYFSGTNGNTKAAVGFDDSDIRAKLNGVTNANIVKTEIYLYFSHWYNNSGGTAILGTHNSAGIQPTWGGLAGKNTDRQRSADWPKPGGRWVTVPNLWAQELRDASSRGVVVGPAPSTSSTYYGTFNGASQSSTPKIRITYKK